MTTDILQQIRQVDPVPESESDRFVHRDLSGGDEAHLVRELSWLRCLNFLVRSEPSEWHLERELAVASELQRRRNLRNGQKRMRGAA